MSKKLAEYFEVLYTPDHSPMTAQYAKKALQEYRKEHPNQDTATWDGLDKYLRCQDCEAILVVPNVGAGQSWIQGQRVETWDSIGQQILWQHRFDHHFTETSKEALVRPEREWCGDLLRESLCQRMEM